MGGIIYDRLTCPLMISYQILIYHSCSQHYPVLEFALMTAKPIRKQYPPVYEKLIPIVLAVIALAVIVLLTVIFLVTMGLFPGSR